ncbi:PREDICTED: ADP-ribosylation factor-like protein 15 [Priapulus caudatus]|uniref:ADP-ribosylation factor-like protein 15 n=1 Tax=Priapulus caudatus TaxID=37621 RepID=A0ABM1EU55_PRICU|nr:PREDICTED: ADP-ribosylation factor-like protein 15 [Priapulus caudatus]
MSHFLANLQLTCALCKICFYSCFTCVLCRRRRRRPKPEIPVICVGLTSSGKTTLLNLLNGEPTTDAPQPTLGFNIKAVEGASVVFSVKELGGGVAPYWRRYYDGARGIVFVVDASADDAAIEAARDTLVAVIVDPRLAGAPCLIVGSFQDRAGARPLPVLHARMDAARACGGGERAWTMRVCSRDDPSAARDAFADFEKYFTQSPPGAAGEAEENRV